MLETQVIDSAEKYFDEIVKPQFDEFFANPATLRYAFNLAAALFHFHEWLYEFHKVRLERHLGKPLTKKWSLWEHAESTNRYFGYVRDLANASKHVRLTISPSTDVRHIANTSFHVPAFNPAVFSNTFQTGGVKMKSHDKHVSFDDCARDLYDFWEQLFRAVK